MLIWDPIQEWTSNIRPCSSDRLFLLTANNGNIKYNVLDVSLNAGGHTRSARAGSLYYNIHPSRVPNMARLLHSNLWTATNLSYRVQGGYISWPLAAVLVTSSIAATPPHGLSDLLYGLPKWFFDAHRRVARYSRGLIWKSREYCT